MTDIVLIEHGAIETRAALLRGGVVHRFWFGPAPGREAEDMRPVEGRVFQGRVRRVDGAIGAAFVDIGADADAFLRLRDEHKASIVEGATMSVRIVAAPRRNKGAVVDYIGAIEGDAAPGRADIVPAPLEAVSALAAANCDTIVDSAACLALLRDGDANARMASGDEQSGLFARYGVHDVLAEALGESVALNGGGALHFAETEALTAIDVDTGAMGGSSADRLREKVIARAALAAALQVERRNISGRIVIDFPSVRTQNIRVRSVAAIEDAIAAISRVSSKSVAGSNFTTLIRERRGGSLWDEATEPALGDPVAGRRYQLSWLARAAMCAAERRQAAAPGLRLCLRAGDLLHERLTQAEHAAEAYHARWGAPLEIACAASMGDQTFEIVER